jgi:putative FmdB family regulatory protein
MGSTRRWRVGFGGPRAAGAPVPDSQKPVEPGARCGYAAPMPIYEFHCGKCEKDSEILVRSSKWDGTKCPHCGSTKLSKKFSTFASATAGGSSGSGAENCSGNGQGSCGRCCGGGPHHHH